MKRPFLLFLPFLLFVAGAFVACEEVQEEGKYDNWRAYNEAYIDSIKEIAGSRIIVNEQVRDVQVGEMFAIQNWFNSTDKNPQYIYCKKLIANPEGKIPASTQTVNAYYYGTMIDGVKFDGGFDGYGALDQNIPNPPEKEPGDFSWTLDFNINSTSLTTGWRILLQHMSVGERWMVYIPSDSAYGSSGSGSIPGYSALVFDVILNDIIN